MASRIHPKVVRISTMCCMRSRMRGAHPLLHYLRHPFGHAIPQNWKKRVSKKGSKCEGFRIWDDFRGAHGPSGSVLRGCMGTQTTLLEQLLGAKAPRLERELPELARWSEDRLVCEAGLAPEQARQLAAAFAIGREVERHRPPERPWIRGPLSVREQVWPLLRGWEREVLLALLLDGKHRLRKIERISEGTLTSALVHPREVYTPAVREAAAALIVVHNHPSGDPEPSEEDVAVTRRLGEAGQLLGIPLLDHIVVAEAGQVSLRERLSLDPIWRSG